MEKLSSFLKKKKPADEVKVVPQCFEKGNEVNFSDFPGKLFEYTPPRGDGNKRPSFPDRIDGILLKKLFLGIYSDQIIELQSASRTTTSKLLVQEVYFMKNLNQVKYHKDGIVTLQYQDKVERKYYLPHHGNECINYLRHEISSRGSQMVPSHAPKDRALNIATAQNFLDVINSLECQFILEPSHHLVLEVMTLLKHAVEFFGEADDERYVTAVENIQKFLQREDVLDVLNEYTSKGGKIESIGEEEGDKGNGKKNGGDGDGDGDETRFVVNKTAEVPPIPTPPQLKCALPTSASPPSPSSQAARPPSVRFEVLKSILEPTASNADEENLEDETFNELLRLRRLSRATSYLRKEFLVFNNRLDPEDENTQEDPALPNPPSPPRSSQQAAADMSMKSLNELPQQTPDVETFILSHGNGNGNDDDDDDLEKGLIDLLSSLYTELDGIIQDYEVKEPCHHNHHHVRSSSEGTTGTQEDGMELLTDEL